MSSDDATGCNSGSAFVIADLHLGDERVAKARGFDNAAAMTETLTARWNRTVSECDTVYVLGDVAKRGHLSPIDALRGEKHLVCGNADDLRAVAAAEVFTTLSVARWLPGIMLTHIPVHPSQLREGCINVHGHLHRASIPDDRYRCVSIDQTGFAPVPLRSLVSAVAQEHVL
ncbi:metallophosphoesterase family protein [Porphyrobacter sp. TH134]|uniref:metallophosphoesterase family protein n=1 Tax=Porphyrobacter sp. TH134 TaxID=2067450 RepID=UPI000C7B3215|nr:metallophosphoesterase family protein [Porphyrobacter sp. TH134]